MSRGLPERRNRRTFLPALLMAACVIFGCSREAEIRDEQRDPDFGSTAVPLPDGGIPVVEDAGLNNPEYPACAERTVERCAPSNDFLCQYGTWVSEHVEACRTAVDCQVGGWLSVHMNDDGCVDSIGMTTPHEGFVQCLVERMGNWRCSCTSGEFQNYLGLPLSACPAPTPQGSLENSGN